jgi:hypothetical protein
MVKSNTSKIEFLRGFTQLRRNLYHKECFHKDGNCSPTLVNAHSIQNNRILKSISRNGFVMYFSFSLKDISRTLYELKEVGRKKATTFSGFCKYHDQEIFKPIELQDYKKGNAEQEFLFAYRALAREYHAKKTAKNISAKIYELFNKKDLNGIQEIFPSFHNQKDNYYEEEAELQGAYLKGINESITRMDRYRGAMNINLEKKRFHKIQTDVIELPEEYKVGVSSMFCIEKDLEGRTVNDFKNPYFPLAPLFLTAFPQNGKTFILFSYFKKNKDTYSFIREQVSAESVSRQKTIVSNIIVIHAENFAVSPESWDKLPPEKQEIFLKYFQETPFEVPEKLLAFPEIDIFV